MDFLDFNSAEPAQSELIPDKTEAKVNMVIRPGGYGPDGWFKMSNSGSGMLDVEFTVLNGRYAKRKFWGYFVLEGNGTDKGQIAVNIARTTLRAIVESAKGIHSTDTSPAAVQGRKIVSVDELNGLEFAARIKIESGKDGYEDKNRLGFAITPDMKQYKDVMAGTAAPVNGATVQRSSNVQTSWQQPAQPVHQPPAQQQPTHQQPAWQQPAQQPPAQQPPPPAASPVPAWAASNTATTNHEEVPF